MFIKESGTIRYRPGVIVVFALTLGLIVASGVLAWLNTRAQEQTAAVVIRTHRVLGVLNQIETTMTDAETGQRGYLLSGDEHFLEPYLSATGQGSVPVIERPPVSTVLAAARKLPLTNATERGLLFRIDGLIKDKLAELQLTIDLRRAGRADQALAIVREGRGKRYMDALRAALVEMRNEERRQLDESEAVRRQAARRAYLSSIGGCVVALCAILLLATSVRRTQLDLMRQEERFHTLADNISQHAWTASSDGRFEWFNQRWQEYTGMLGGDLEVQWDQATSHPAHRERVERGMRQAFASGQAWEDTFPLRARDGAWRWFLVRALPIRAPGGVLRWFGTNTDIDDQRRLDDALKEANTRKDEFIATLAHELRNPLAPIQAGLELMRISPAFPLPLSRTREIMSRQMAQLVRLIDDLLDVSRISTGKLELKRTRVMLRDLIDSALETHRPRFEQARHALDLRLAPDALAVDGDPVRLAQVLGNLLDNAAKYTPDGGRIRVEAERDGEAAVVRVIDNGIGIDPSMLPRVFDLFSQAPDGSDRRQGGIGIGLAIARQLAQLHGGTLSAHSAGPGEGSTFELRLPLAQGAPKNAPPAPAHAQRPGVGSRRILVLDDNVDAAQTLGNLLGLAGHSVQLAHSGQEALDLAVRFKPELAFLDIGLPDMSGYDVARALRAHPDLRDAYLVALTGWGAASDRLKSKEAGIDLHLTKPVSLDALAAALPDLALPVRQSV